MNEAESIATWDALKSFGFQSDDAVMSDVRPGLSFDFGDFKLSASCVLGKHFNDVVLFTGCVVTTIRLAEICFELPRRLRSASLCGAFLAYYLNEAAPAGNFPSVFEPDWLREGLQNKHLLPWEVDMATYNARPRCTVRREWLRLGLKSLIPIVENASDEALVGIEFNGEILKIRCRNQLVAIPAEGEGWSQFYTIPAGKFRSFPKRLMNENLEVSIFSQHLNFGGRRYGGVAAE